MERARHPRGPGRLAEFSTRARGAASTRLTREIYALAGEEFNIGSPKQLGHDPVREAQAAAGADAPRPATRPTPTCWSSSRSATRCPRGSSSTARWPSSSRPTPTRCRCWSTRAPAASTPRSTSSWPRPDGSLGSAQTSRTFPCAPSSGGASAPRSSPSPGWRFVAADYSQIELRILAHVSGEESLIEAFRRGEDIHRRTAAEVFGVAPDAVTARAARHSPRPPTSR